MWHETMFVELKTSPYRYKKECFVAFQIRQNDSPTGAPPQTPLGARRYLTPLVSWGGDTPPISYPTRRLQRLDSPSFGTRHSAPSSTPFVGVLPPQYFSLVPILNFNASLRIYPVFFTVAWVVHRLASMYICLMNTQHQQLALDKLRPTFDHLMTRLYWTDEWVV